jgi:hypothetical protein
MKIRFRVLALFLLSVAVLGTDAAPTNAASRHAAVTPLAVAAGGDTCATATVIASVPLNNDTGDTTGATDNIRLTGCAGLSLEGPDHVYAFTVSAGNNLTFTLTPTDPEYDPAIYVRTACAQGAGTCVAKTDAVAGGQAESITVSGLAPGTYYFFIDSAYPVEDPAGEGHYSLSVTGTLGTPNNASFYTLTPCRVLDTREASGSPALIAGATRVFTVVGQGAGQCQVPPTAKAVSVNVTVTQPTSPGYLTLFPGGTPPLASTINFFPGQTRANNAIVPLGANGTISVLDGQASGGTHFILDVNGYFQ